MRFHFFCLLSLWLLSGCSSGQGNALPTVTISGPSEVVERSLVTLNSTTSDSDGEVVAYRWVQVSGPTVSADTFSNSFLEFEAPSIDDDEAVVFRLSVEDDSGGAASSSDVTVLVLNSLADTNAVMSANVSEDDAQPSVFITSLQIDVDPNVLEVISFTIEPRPGAVADPVRVSRLVGELARTEASINLPVFGLYQDFINTVILEFTYVDGSSSVLTTELTTDLYEDNPIQPTVNVSAAGGDRPSFSYFYLKSRFGIHILDIDGFVRWAANTPLESNSSTYDAGRFVVFVGDEMFELALSGEVNVTGLAQEGLSNIQAHHDVDRGKFGYLVEIDADKEGRSERIIESILLEVDESGTTINEWDYGIIFRDLIEAEGYDSSNFVRDGVDWFHMNSAIYDPSDNSIIASSRENFVVKIDYDTHEILWLLGDETKHWYVNYPPLQALSLSSADVKPIGQHALSIVEGDLMLFNNGQFSFQSPEGEPRGETLTSSPASRYRIDQEIMEAEIVWNYDPSVYSDICSSVFRDPSSDTGDYLVHYSAVDRLDTSEPPKPTRTLIKGINEDGVTLFEFQLPTRFCQTAWQSRPLPQMSSGAL